MFRSIATVLLFFFTAAAYADESELNLAHLGQKYFDLWTATQSPEATENDIDNYLTLLTNDVGHQHLPYDSDDSRQPDGKKSIKNGMFYYLAAHTEYSATLTSITQGYNVVIVKYYTKSKGVHPQTNQEISLSYDTTEVLEIESGKVSVIRKYSD